MRKVYVVVLLALAVGCGVPPQFIVINHPGETSKNHYVVIKNDGYELRCYDCYSRPDSITWNPMCREIHFFNNDYTNQPYHEGSPVGIH